MTNAPNIVLIHADQYRFDCFSLRGHPHVQTPTLDRLARSGVDFTAAYSECPICIPARHTALTGLDPQASGVLGFAERARIARPDTTLPALLKRAGYQTAHVGRDWHQYPAHAHYGFETYDADPFTEQYSTFHDLFVPGQHGDKPNWPHFGTHALEPNSSRARPWSYPEEFHQTNFAVNKGVEFLQRRDRERPFFLSLGTVAPHPPLTPPASYLERYLRQELDPPAVGDWAERPANEGLGLGPQSGRQILEGERLREAKAGYYGLISHLDDQLALFLARLKQRESNTYIIFLSDHGEMLGDHYLWRKSQPYEGSAHIPFFLSGPDIALGKEVDVPTGLQDLLPTCCDIAGVAVPEHITGRSVLGLARGNSPPDWRNWLHGEHAPVTDIHPGFHYLTDGASKYIWFIDGREQLFNLKDDPRELDDLSTSATNGEALNVWRERLIQRLAKRPEGFVSGGTLVPNVRYEKTNRGAVVDTANA